MRCAVAVLALLFELPDTRVEVTESYPATGVNAKRAAFYLLLLTRLTAGRNLTGARPRFDKLMTIFQTFG